MKDKLKIYFSFEFLYDALTYIQKLREKDILKENKKLK